MSIYVILKSLVDKFFLPRRARRRVKIGPAGWETHAGCRVRKEVWLEPRRVRPPAVT